MEITVLEGSFEVLCEDMLARIGRLKTKRGVLETPALLPVINPNVQVVKPRKIYEEMGYNAVMTNAYIIKRSLSEEAVKLGVHRILDFPGIVMTDSGAYQLLSHGRVDVEPGEIVKFQEEIGSDIAVILDVPTGFNVDYAHASWTVDETLSRARQALNIIKERDILWVGPVQGGKYLDLVKKSAEAMSQLPFHLYALGSPTRVMEQYRFNTLVDMILTAKIHLPIEKPFHLFGAGHPFMFSLAVALGCDLFDSASYALYARNDRYMTPHATLRVEQLNYLPCSCPVCVKLSCRELKAMSREERERILATHNLYVCQAELKLIKQAIHDGRLWELIEVRARSHPSLLAALRKLLTYVDHLEKHTPISKKRGILCLGPESAARPEILRYRRRLKDRYRPSPTFKVMLLIPKSRRKPYSRDAFVKSLLNRLAQEFGAESEAVHICVYDPFFSIVPLELDDIYPISQSESFEGWEDYSQMLQELKAYLPKAPYKAVVLYSVKGVNDEEIKDLCAKLNIKLSIIKAMETLWSKAALKALVEQVKNALRNA
ncbi:MAG: tRNA guanosine(15) transglycosylase TgtA [Candidatus Nezhaarchaeales archaeon]